MAIKMRGWFDDSTRLDSQHRVAALAGCVGTAEQWQIQDAAWRNDVLERFGLPYFHVREFATFAGPYEQFKDKPVLSLELSQAILGTSQKSQLRSFGAMTRLDDLTRFNRERSRNISHYALNIYTCMFNIKQIFRKELTGDDFVQMCLDISSDDQGTNQAIKLANLYASTHPWHGPVENIAPQPMPKEGMARHTPALQVADFVVAEMRKYT